MNDKITLSELDVDVTQFKQDLEAHLLEKSGIWRGNLTTMVGTALIDSMSTIGTFLQERINSAYENSFTDTAVIDDAIFAIATMKGVRLTRRLPASITATISCEDAVSIPAYSTFTCVGYSFFNRETIQLAANEPLSVTLFQGEPVFNTLKGSGERLQAFATPEDSFRVSDMDTTVMINGLLINKSFGNLWNYKKQDAYIDLTLANGRMLVQFGTEDYGAMPGVNDIVQIGYVITEGAAGNNITTLDAQITLNGFSKIKGVVNSNPTGGAAAKSAFDYKNNTAGVFGLYGSAVTPSQYRALVNTYPGIIDAITRAQREIDPSNVQLMNVIYVTGITVTPWTDTDKTEFINWLQDQTMASCRFVWIDAIPVKRDIDITVHCFSSAVLSNVKMNVEHAIRELLKARPGILDLDIYRSDIITAVRNADSNVSYVTINEPTDEMLVTQASAPDIFHEVLDNKGQLKPLFYSYSISYVDNLGEESKINAWTHPRVNKDKAAVKLRWRPKANAVKYKIFGRESTGIGLLKEIEAKSATIEEGMATWTDDGSTTPDTSKFIRNRFTDVKYNTLGKLNVNVMFANRQQVVNSLTPIRHS